MNPRLCGGLVVVRGCPTVLPTALTLFSGLCRPGGDLLFRVLRRSTIGAGGFHGRVRDGIGCLSPRHGHQAGEDQNVWFRDCLGWGWFEILKACAKGFVCVFSVSLAFALMAAHGDRAALLPKKRERYARHLEWREERANRAISTG